MKRSLHAAVSCIIVNDCECDSETCRVATYSSLVRSIWGTPGSVMNPSICVLTFNIPQGRKSERPCSLCRARTYFCKASGSTSRRYNFSSTMVLSCSIFPSSRRSTCSCCPQGWCSSSTRPCTPLTSSVSFAGARHHRVRQLDPPEPCNRPSPPWGSRGDGNAASSMCSSLLSARRL